MPLSFVAIWALFTGPSRAIFILLAVSVDDMASRARARPGPGQLSDRAGARAACRRGA